MYQNKKHFSEWSNLYRPLCSVAVLCTSLLVVPDVAFATGIQTTSIITQQQQIVVKGKVVDASGETIIGATILQVGSQSNGAITDIDGNFTIKVPAGTTLEISYIGYITQRVKAQPDFDRRHQNFGRSDSSGLRYCEKKRFDWSCLICQERYCKVDSISQPYGGITR